MLLTRGQNSLFFSRLETLVFITNISTSKPTPLNFWRWTFISRNHQAISLPIVGICIGALGPKLLVKTGHTNAAIKLKGMWGARLIIFSPCPTLLQVPCICFWRSKIEDRLQIACSGFCLRWPVCVSEGILGDYEGHMQRTGNIFHKRYRSKGGNMVVSPTLHFFLCTSPFLSVLLEGLIKSTNLIINRLSGASCRARDNGGLKSHSDLSTLLPNPPLWSVELTSLRTGRYLQESEQNSFRVIMLA